MDNQIETAGTNDAPIVRQPEIKACIEEIQFLTDELEGIVRMPMAALLGNVDATGARRWRRDVEQIFRNFFQTYAPEFNMVLPLEEIERFDPVLNRFVKAANDFDALATQIIVALEQFENLSKGRAH